jgi:hypothetical protein
MGVGTQSNVCLGIAVDHRIRALCKPVTVSSKELSKHISLIQTLGESLERSHKEIQVTTELARTAFKGGIAITLKQPRDNHPFEEGIDKVIEDCETLYALYEIFRVVSCETLDIRSDIGIVDLLPYMSDNLTEVDDADLKEFFDQSAQAICDMNPSFCSSQAQYCSLSGLPSTESKGRPGSLKASDLVRRLGRIPNYPSEQGFLEGMAVSSLSKGSMVSTQATR